MESSKKIIKLILSDEGKFKGGLAHHVKFINLSNRYSMLIKDKSYM